jgi:hypothetical protein
VKIIAAAVGPHSGAPDDVLSLLTIEPKTNVIEELGPAHGYDKWSGEILIGRDTLGCPKPSGGKRTGTT